MSYTFTAADITTLSGKATITCNGVNVVAGTVVNTGDSLVITAVAGKRFRTIYNGTYDFQISAARFQVTNSDSTVTRIPFIVNDANNAGTLTFPETGSATQAFYVSVNDEVLAYTLTQADIDELTNKHVTMVAHTKNAAVGMKLYVGDLVTINANAGFKFVRGTAPDGNTGMVLTYFVKTKTGFTTKTYAHFSIRDPATSKLVDTTLPAPESGFVFTSLVVTTESDGSVVTMDWGNKPTAAQVNVTSNFTWTGGVAPFSVVVLQPDGVSEHDNVTGLATGSYNLVVQAGNPLGNYTVNVKDSSATQLTLTATINITPPPAYYNIKQIDLDNAAAAHATLKVGNTPATLGMGVSLGDIITATADIGYEFTLISDPLLPSKQIASVYYLETSKYGNKNTPFTLSSDKKTCTFTMVATTGSFIYSQIKVTSVQLTPDVTGTNNIYKIDDDILAAVNRKRFKIVSSGSPTPNETVYDYGQFILSVLKIPFEIPTEYILNDENIILANLDTTISAPALSSDVIKIDMGSITVNPVNNNLLDYINTVALIHLPRVDSIAIDLEYVIGKTLHIEYLLDCYTGRATVNISSTETGETIITKQVDIGVSVPYINIHNDAQLSNNNVEVGGDNGIKTPFIELVKVDSLLADGMFTIPIIDESELTNQTGFIRIEEINLNSAATRNEKNELVSILRNGVLIK